jgi:hypothetical protein
LKIQKMAHWNDKEYGPILYCETEQIISTEGVAVMTSSELAAYKFRRLNVQPFRGSKWDMIRELQAFSFECPERNSFNMWCRREQHSTVEECHVNAHGLTNEQITVGETAYTDQVDRHVRKFEREQREDGEYVPLTRTFFAKADSTWWVGASEPDG